MAEVLRISLVTERDVSEIVSIGESTNEAQVIPHLSAEGQKNMRAARKRDMLRVADSARFHSLKAEVGSEVVGYVSSKNGNHIAQLYVSPKFQRRGIGKALVYAAMRHLGYNEISVRASVNAIEFYRHCGFTPLGEEKEIEGIKFVPMVWYANT